MKKITITLILSLVIILSGCGKSDNMTEYNNIDTKTTFEADANTIKIKENINKENDNTNYNKVNTVEQESSFGEIVLNGSSNELAYQIDGNDIIANGIRYSGLYDTATNIDIPCDYNTFITFIIKYININDDVIIMYTKDDTCIDNESGLDIEDTSTKVADDLEGLSGYREIRDKYNADVTCSVTIFNNKGNVIGALCTCSKYIMYMGGTEAIYIDMSEYSTETDENISDNIGDENTDISKSEENNNEY